ALFGAARFRLPDGLVAAALPARDAAAVLPFNGGRHHPAVLSRADSDAAGTDTNGDVAVAIIPVMTVIAIVVTITAWPDLNVDALCHLNASGLDRSDERGSGQHRCSRYRSHRDLHHVGVLPWVFREV